MQMESGWVWLERNFKNSVSRVGYLSRGRFFEWYIIIHYHYKWNRWYCNLIFVPIRYIALTNDCFEVKKSQRGERRCPILPELSRLLHFNPLMREVPRECSSSDSLTSSSRTGLVETRECTFFGNNGKKTWDQEMDEPLSYNFTTLSKLFKLWTRIHPHPGHVQERSRDGIWPSFQIHHSSTSIRLDHIAVLRSIVEQNSLKVQSPRVQSRSSCWKNRSNIIS